MNKIPVAICTKGRYGVNTRKDGSLAYQSFNLGDIYTYAINNDLSILNRVYLFIEPKEVSEYTKSFPKWPLENIIILGDNDQGLAYTRQTALLYFQSINCEMMVMLDDDCNVQVRIF